MTNRPNHMAVWRRFPGRRALVVSATLALLLTAWAGRRFWETKNRPSTP